MASRRLHLLAGSALVLSTGAHGVVEQLPSPDNDAALSAWEEATGQDAPGVRVNADGTTELDWSGVASFDLYARDASGGALLTPMSSGMFHALGVQGEWHAAAKEDRSWAQIAASASNDRALLATSTQLNSFQAGRATQDFRLAVGDVPVLHSDLGASAAMRGLSVQRRFDATTLSFAAGVIAPSWEAISDAALRAEPIRNAVAFKASHALSRDSVLFSTVQAFDDSGAPLAPTATVLPEAGQSGTIGVVLRRGRFALQAEAGIGRSDLSDEPARTGGAMLIDGTWSAQRFTVRGGHHDLSPSFATLSTTTARGVRESYLNTSWIVAPSATITLDLRDTLDREPDPTPEELALQSGPPQARARAVTLQGAVAPSAWPGVSANATVSRSRGESDDGTRNDVDSASVALTFLRGRWSGAVGYQISAASVQSSGTSDSTLQGVHARAGRSFPNLLPGAVLNAQLNAQLQRQRFSAGNDSQLATLGVELSAQREGWGELALSASTARGHDPQGLPLRQHLVKVDATHPLSTQLSLRAYLSASDNFPDVDAIAYREVVAGAQITYRF